jgi:SPASM domain peptide maturase of grasp-with-spasm system
MELYFKLYSFCLPVMGKTGALIVNLQKITCTTIPQFLCEILLEYDNVDIATLKSMYNDNDNTIEQYFDRLEREQIGFYTHEPERYPRMELDWHAPETIKFAVLQIEDYSRFDYKDILSQLDELMCKNIEIWFTGAYTKAQLEDLLSHTNNSMLRSITMVLPYNHDLQVSDYEELTASYMKLGQIYLHRAPRRIKLPDSRVFGIRRNLGNYNKAFTNIPRDEYIIFLEFFTESLKYNPYYNKKICIDADGYFRNCLTHSKEFGNVRDRKLKDVAEDEGFRELWHVCNDRILDIKDSEFRYIWLNTHELEKVDETYYRMI